jgi:tetratricopeptide (TPR) repeat protein
MSYQVIDLNCPGCGGGVSTSQKQCNYCGRPIVISSFNDMQSFSPLELNKYLSQNSVALANNSGNDALNMSQAMCKLKLKLYDDAFPFFKIAQNSFTNSEPFYYAAVSLLKGKKAFLALRTDIDKILENLNAAIMIEPRGIYHYFLAYIKYDYFERRCLNIIPNWEETLQTAIQTGVPSADVTQLFEMLQVEMLECLSVF